MRRGAKLPKICVVTGEPGEVLVRQSVSQLKGSAVVGGALFGAPGANRDNVAIIDIWLKQDVIDNRKRRAKFRIPALLLVLVGVLVGGLMELVPVLVGSLLLAIPVAFLYASGSAVRVDTVDAKHVSLRVPPAVSKAFAARGDRSKRASDG